MPGNGEGGGLALEGGVRCLWPPHVGWRQGLCRRSPNDGELPGGPYQGRWQQLACGG